VRFIYQLGWFFFLKKKPTKKKLKSLQEKLNKKLLKPN
jgi:hypothetical protein